jgi:capsular exopolysaccharide synthesis family protein
MMVNRPEESVAPVSLRDYVTVVRLHARLILVTMGVSVILATAFSLLKTPVYTSEATVLAEPLRLNTEQEPVQPNMLTEQEVASSAAVARRAGERLGVQQSPSTLLQGLEVETVTESEILTILYTHQDPEVARRVAQAFARSYLDFRHEETLVDLEALREPLETRLQELRVQLEQLNDDIAEAGNPGEEDALRAETESVVGQIALLQNELTQVTAPESVRSGEILSPAVAPTAPSSPNLVLNAALGLVLGLAAGVALAFLREHLGDRIRGSAELESQSGAPVLGIIPRVGHAGSALLTRRRTSRAVGEAFRALQTALMSTTSKRGARSILITSPHSGEGKTTITASLGLTLARAGRQVVVVPADLRKPDLVQLVGDWKGIAGFPAPNGNGEVGMADGSQEGTIRLVPVETVTDSNGELLSPDVLGARLAELRNGADIVLIDSPPVIEVADTLSVATLVDGVLLVAAGNVTHRSSVREARRLLDQVDARVVGSVLNQSAAPGKSRYYER